MLTETLGETTVYVMGKCPIQACKARRRHTLPGKIVRNGRYTLTEWKIPAAEPYGAVHARLGARSDVHAGWGNNPRPSKWLESHKHPYDRAWFAAVEAAGWICADHDRFMVTVEIKGVYNAAKPCSTSCEGATGRSCDCVCGGEFHGSRWG